MRPFISCGPPMNISKPKMVGPVRATCPVCGKTAYSHGGIHPQCAVSQADAVSRVAIKKAAAKAPPVPPRQQWSKTCPRCHRQVPARRVTCDCGHEFIPTSKS